MGTTAEGILATAGLAVRQTPSAPQASVGRRRRVREDPDYPGWPDLDSLPVEDGKPVDSVFSDRLMRMLIDPLAASSWRPPGGGPHALLANVGLYYRPGVKPIVPDVMLSLGVRISRTHNRRQRELTYIVPHRGKPPELAIEIVSNRRGGELSRKVGLYEDAGLTWYVVYDPLLKLGPRPLYAFRRQADKLKPWSWPGEVLHLDDIGLGLTMWEGVYVEHATWLRWCKPNGQLYPTGREARLAARQRLIAERKKLLAEREKTSEAKDLAERERQKAATALEQAERERQRADQAEAEAQRLRKLLKQRKQGRKP